MWSRTKRQECMSPSGFFSTVPEGTTGNDQSLGSGRILECPRTAAGFCGRSFDWTRPTWGFVGNRRFQFFSVRFENAPASHVCFFSGHVEHESEFQLNFDEKMGNCTKCVRYGWRTGTYDLGANVRNVPETKCDRRLWGILNCESHPSSRVSVRGLSSVQIDQSFGYYCSSSLIRLFHLRPTFRCS